MPALARLGAVVETPSPLGELSRIDALMAATRADDLQRQLPALTGGEGVLEAAFGGYRAVSGEAPARPRSTPKPLNLAEYMLSLAARTRG